MQKLKFFIVTFIIVYLIYFFTVILRKKTNEKLIESVELRYLKKKYQINITNHNIKSMTQVVALSNSFIIAATFTLISFVENLLLKMLLGFFILIILEILIYHFIGKYYQSRERGNKNV